MKLKKLINLINRDMYALVGWRVCVGRCVKTPPFDPLYQDRKVLLIDLEKKIIRVKPKHYEL